MNQTTLTINLLKKLLIAHIVMLIIFSIFRVAFFINFQELANFNGYYLDILRAFFLGFRIDLTVVGYIQVIPTLSLIILYYIKKERFFTYFNSFLIYYLFIFYTVATFLAAADFGFYSYFKDHINILFFGLFDDDTSALLATFWQNYNVILIVGLCVIYLVSLFLIIKKIFSISYKHSNSFFGLKIPLLFFSLLIIANIFIIRGSFGMYPLGGRMISNVSSNEYINKVSNNGVRSYINAYKLRKKFLQSKYDLIKETGFQGNLEKAFKIHKHTDDINTEDLLQNITYKTKKVDDEEYNVVVIMVESFGSAILEYQSENFDILGNLKKHFEEDTLFTNFLSSGDGTIASLEALLLNMPYRPNTFPFSQSNYKQISFKHTPAFLYNEEGYNTSFIYGGDLTWRDIGNFIKYQGYKKVEGKMDIYSALEPSKSQDDYFHPWGIFDEHLYDYIFKKLEQSSGKEFIVALSTNNHPPYNIPNDYTSKNLVINEDLKNHITGDLDLAQMRFKSYSYTIDKVGVFLDKFKQSSFKDNTIIVITADNNTIDGIMKYDKNTLLNSKKIPFYLYMPEKLKNKLTINTEVASSHKDIFPTLYNLTLKQKEYLSIGSDLFDSTMEHYGFNGSLIVNKDAEIEKLDSLDKPSDSKIINYYKASLAVTQYLIEKIAKENNR